MKKFLALLLVCMMLLSLGGCMKTQQENTVTPEKELTETVGGDADSQGNGNSVSTGELSSETTENQETENIEQSEDVNVIEPLPDTTMDNLTDAILSVSLEEGAAYVDDAGIMQMDLKIYTYDKYDMVDIANLKVGDIIVRNSEEVEVTSKEQNEAGTIFINGGLDMGGFDLVTDDCGIFFEMGYSDAKSWYEVGEATIRVSADFLGSDRSDLDKGEVLIYPGDFLVGAVENYNFTPYNTTIRVEEGQIVELNKVYVP